MLTPMESTLLPEVWIPLAHAHAARADELTADHRARRATGARHAIDDFLYDYYGTRPSVLRRWHPGAGTGLAPSSDGPAPHAGWRWYRTDRDRVVSLDRESYLRDRGDGVRHIRELLTATASRPPYAGCFGLHEWAMVYRLDPSDVRHAGWPLRLGAAGTDAVVDSHQIACSHFDAHRFFTPEAAPLNALTPTRESQTALEQPGCLHAGMDLYKWAHKLVPAVPSDLVLDCFELARDIRTLDMRAAPYDLRELGYEPVCIETPEGKAAYAAAQRGFSARGQELRARLVNAIDAVLCLTGPPD